MNKVMIISYNQSYQAKWDQFVDNSNNGTIFHKQIFLDYHPDDRFDRDDIIAYKKNKIIAVLPINTIYENQMKIAVSPYGASFGGIVTKRNSSQKTKMLIAEIFSFLKQKGYSILRISLPPYCYWHNVDKTLEYFLLKNNKWDLNNIAFTSVLDLRDKSYKNNMSRNIKKAKNKGIKIIQSEDIAAFYNILYETIVIKHESKITHSKNELFLLKRILNNKMKIFFAEYNNIKISAVLVFEINEKSVFAFYNCHLMEYSHIPSLSLVFDHIINYYKDSHYYLDLGTTDNLKSTENWGLFRFKEGLGAEGYLRKYYEIKL